MRIALTLLAVAALLAPLAAQKRAPDDDVCPWCRNDPALMKAAGVVSHGPMPIGPKDSVDLAATLGPERWLFLETAHIRWASSLGATNVDRGEQQRVAAELDELRKALPDVPKVVKKLDPHLRLHLLAQRGEKLYARFQEVLGVKDEDFPEQRAATGPYMGNGRYLGEKDKFELVLHRQRDTHKRFVETFSGAAVEDALRWHMAGQHKMIASIPAEDSDLREDRWLFPHVAHNLTHLMFCAYKHFSYDPPVWLDEGLAIAMEKEIEPSSLTNEGEEGTFRDDKGPSDWAAAARKLASSGKAVSLAELMHRKSFGELERDAAVVAWSMVRFLIDEHPASFAPFLGDVKGQLDEKGYPTGSDLPGLQRASLKRLFGWSPAELDQEWRAWITRPPPAPKKGAPAEGETGG